MRPRLALVSTAPSGPPPRRAPQDAGDALALADSPLESRGRPGKGGGGHTALHAVGAGGQTPYAPQPATDVPLNLRVFPQPTTGQYQDVVGAFRLWWLWRSARFRQRRRYGRWLTPPGYRRQTWAAHWTLYQTHVRGLTHGR